MGFPFGSIQPKGYFLKRFGKLEIMDHLECHFEVVDSTVVDFILGFSFAKAVGFGFGFLGDPSLIDLVAGQLRLDH